MSISEILSQAYGEPNAWAEQQLDALIRQDRRELLEFLKNHAVAENDEVYFIKVKKSSLEAELQHLTGLEEREADDGTE